MTLLQELRAKGDRIRTIGAEARVEARDVGVPSYYVDAAAGESIVEELPDGSKQPVSPKTPATIKSNQAA